METFSINCPINLFEDEEWVWLLAVKSYEATNSVFNQTDANNSFSISTPGQCHSSGGTEKMNKPENYSEMRHKNDIGIDVEVFRKSGSQIIKKPIIINCLTSLVVKKG